MKRSVQLMFLACSLAVVLVGCGPSTGSPGTSAEQDELTKYVNEHADDEGVEPPPN
jgi:hypothetical protein